MKRHEILTPISDLLLEEEIKALEQYSPAELIEKEVRQSIKKIVRLRDSAKSEEIQLKAASKILDKHMPEKIEHLASFTVNFVVQPHDDREEILID